MKSTGGEQVFLHQAKANAQQAAAALVREWEMFIYWNQELRYKAGEQRSHKAFRRDNSRQCAAGKQLKYVLKF